MEFGRSTVAPLPIAIAFTAPLPVTAVSIAVMLVLLPIAIAPLAAVIRLLLPIAIAFAEPTLYFRLRRIVLPAPNAIALSDPSTWACLPIAIPATASFR